MSRGSRLLCLLCINLVIQHCTQNCSIWLTADVIRYSWRIKVYMLNLAKRPVRLYQSIHWIPTKSRLWLYFNVFRKSDLWQDINVAILLPFSAKIATFWVCKCVNIQNSNTFALSCRIAERWSTLSWQQYPVYTMKLARRAGSSSQLVELASASSCKWGITVLQRLWRLSRFFVHEN